LKVLSLFDGMSCGQIALNRAGIKYDNYYASEIKKEAIKVTQYNYPDTIQIGSVLDVKANDLPDIALMVGGSPCQDFSRGNSERLGLEGLKSGLFFEYYRIFKELKPKYFLLENVRMDTEDMNYISSLMGVTPVRINSSLVSAQLRDRVYWTNIPGDDIDFFSSRISKPKGKNILFQDILNNGFTPLIKSRCLLESDSEPLSTPVKMFHRFHTTGFTSLIFESEEHYEKCVKHYDENYKGLSTDNFNLDNSIYDNIRYLSQTELEKLQTVPEGYTNILSRNQAAGLLGNGWTVDIIAHIFKGLK